MQNILLILLVAILTGGIYTSSYAGAEDPAENQKLQVTDKKLDVNACEFDVDIESLGDLIKESSPWVDIEEVSLQIDSSTLYGEVKVTGPIPEERILEGQSDGIATHLAMDVNSDGEVDYAVDVGMKANSDVTGLLTDYDNGKTYGYEGDVEEFPGKASMTDNSFLFELPLSAIGNARTFEWFALTYWVLVEGELDNPDQMVLELADIYPLDLNCPYNDTDNFASFPSGSVKPGTEEPPITLAMKQKDKLTLVSIKNNSDIPVYGIGLHANDGVIKYVKAKGWDREKVDPNTILIQTFDRPVMKKQNMVVLLILDNKSSTLEWATFDMEGIGLSSGSLPDRDKTLPLA